MSNFSQLISRVEVLCPAFFILLFLVPTPKGLNIYNVDSFYPIFRTLKEFNLSLPDSKRQKKTV
jgi:hypothetical protein